ncbi:hypothetical protein IFR05_014604 [Cadophora sp. M221]|nr:hypothetical protein IFR05_014604 [Cadophora sp. M221]
MFRLPKKSFLLITLIFAFIGVISVFKYTTTPIAPRPISARQDEDVVFAPPVDLPAIDEPTDRVSDFGLGGWNRVMCYPSVGGIIINRHVTSVELNFLHRARFEDTPRSSDPNEEDAFCRQLRRTGGKWWASYWSYTRAVISRDIPISTKERETLVLGWPNNGGVWVLQERNWGNLSRGGWAWRNAHTMEERCIGMEMSSALYYANPEDCEPVRALLVGFGEHDREPRENYYYNMPADRFRDL